MSFVAAGMPIKFKIPIRSLELCEQSTEPNVFYVQDRIDVGRWKEKDLLQTLTNIMESIGGDRKQALKILTNDVFDPIYSMLFHLDDVSTSVRKELLLTLQHGLNRLCNLMDGTKVLEWASENFLSSSTIAQLIREEPQCKMAI